jgi:O-antigen/teichoic acid export membrane protein
MDYTIKKKLISSTKNKTVSLLFSTIIKFTLNIYLLRTIPKEFFGASVLIFSLINFFTLFSDFGISTYVVTRTKDSEEIFNTIFTALLLISSTIYMTAYLSVGYLSEYYKYDFFNFLLPITFLALPFTLLEDFFNSIIQKRHLFRIQNLLIVFKTLILLISTVFFSIYFTNKMYALVFPFVISQFIGMLFSFHFSNFRIKFELVTLHLKSLFNFGKNILLTKVFNFISDNGLILFFGGYYGKLELANYSTSKQINDYSLLFLGSPIHFNLIALFDKKKHEENIYLFQKIHTLFLLIFAPISIYIFFTLDQTIPLIIGHKWQTAILYTKILFILTFIKLISPPILPILYNYGKETAVTILTFIKFFISILFFLILKFTHFSLINSLIFFILFNSIVQIYYVILTIKVLGIQFNYFFLPILLILTLMFLLFGYSYLINIPNLFLSLAFKTVFFLFIYYFSFYKILNVRIEKYITRLLKK